jgi:SAM-dependent methyltransferase
MPVHERYREYVKDQRQFFDELVTEDWDTYFSAEWDETRRYEVAQLFARIQPATILDVGCGCGFHDQEMARYEFVRTVDAVDYSQKSIEKANETYPHEKVKRWAADIEQLALSPRYELVVSFQVFEHLDSPSTYFEFCRRACADDAHIAIFTPNRWRLHNVRRRLRGLEAELCDPQHFREYSIFELRKLGETHGFSFVSWFGYGLNGAASIDRRPLNERLRLGLRLPWIANCFCLLMRKRP